MRENVTYPGTTDHPALDGVTVTISTKGSPPWSATTVAARARWPSFCAACTPRTPAASSGATWAPPRPTGLLPLVLHCPCQHRDRPP